MGKLMLDGVEVGLPDRSVTAGGVSFDPTVKNILPNTATDCQKAIDALSDKLIKHTSVTGTTDQYGVLVTSFTTNDFIVVSAISAGSVIIPFVNAGYAWRLKVTDHNLNPKTSTSITAYIYYVEA